MGLPNIDMLHGIHLVIKDKASYRTIYKTSNAGLILSPALLVYTEYL